MKRYLNGVRMLEDLENENVNSYEKAFFLIFALLPIGTIIDSLVPALQITKEHSSFDKIENFIYAMLILIFVSINKKIDNKNAIERFLSLFVVATITSYIFLIPASFLLEFIINRIADHQTSEKATSFIMNFYTTAFILGSLVLWKRKIENTSSG